jgi:sulfite reductase alpha subunit-like flavoprotein
MLAVNKPLMEMTFSNMLTEKTGMLYKAAYEAFYETTKPTKGDGSVNPDTEQQIYDTIEKSAKENAEKFAKTFVKTLKDAGFDSTLADEIDKHVKSIEPIVTLIVPTQGALANAGGPVAGTLVGTTTNGAIQIM